MNGKEHGWKSWISFEPLLSPSIKSVTKTFVTSAALALMVSHRSSLSVLWHCCSRTQPWVGKPRMECAVIDGLLPLQKLLLFSDIFCGGRLDAINGISTAIHSLLLMRVSPVAPTVAPCALCQSRLRRSDANGRGKQWSNDLSGLAITFMIWIMMSWLACQLLLMMVWWLAFSINFMIRSINVHGLLFNPLPPYLNSV